jgi:hypothetical protein
MMWQYQDSTQEAQETQAYADAAAASKWWHVPDGQIDEMIRRLNGDSQALNSSQGGMKASKSALRSTPSASLSSLERQQNVHFNDGGYYEDALDQVMRQSREETPKKARGSWRVSDAALVDFIQKTKQALGPEAEETAAEKDDFYGLKPIGRTGSLIISQTASSPSSNIRSTPSISQHIKRSNSLPAGILKPGSIRRNVRPWAKTDSRPRLFAPVGIGLDGKGTKVISARPKFAEGPIYLGDARDFHMESVRIRVCGHPFYLKDR